MGGACLVMLRSGCNVSETGTTHTAEISKKRLTKRDPPRCTSKEATYKTEREPTRYIERGQVLQVTACTHQQKRVRTTWMSFRTSPPRSIPFRCKQRFTLIRQSPMSEDRHKDKALRCPGCHTRVTHWKGFKTIVSENDSYDWIVALALVNLRFIKDSCVASNLDRSKPLFSWSNFRK